MGEINSIAAERILVQIADNLADDGDKQAGESYNEKFPDELRKEMIARVACVTHLFQLRLVCKAWNAVITSPDLAKLHATKREQHQAEPWLLVARRMRPQPGHRQKALYLICDPSTRQQWQWIAPPLPFLQATQSSNCIPCDLSTCKSHGGLVCCIASRPSQYNKTILIFNPITRAYKILPTPPCYPGLWSARRNVIQQYDDEEAPTLDLALWTSMKGRGHFKIAICDTATREVRVFDSSKGHWREGSKPPDRFKPRFQGFRDSTCKEELYWYDVEVDRWCQTRLPQLVGAHEVLKWPSVFKGGDGRLMLAAVLVHAGAVAGFGVWAQGCGAAATEHTSWVHISSTPPGFVHGKLHRLKDSKLICHPNYVCMTGLLRFSLCPWNCFYPWILAFSPTQQTWKWSPHPLGHKTWAKFRAICLLDPTLRSIR
eukprot:c13858_g1_i1 orf=611-1897(+)